MSRQFDFLPNVHTKTMLSYSKMLPIISSPFAYASFQSLFSPSTTPANTKDRKFSLQLFSLPHKSFVLSSDSLTHLAELSGFLRLKPTLKGFGSLVKAVEI